MKQQKDLIILFNVEFESQTNYKIGLLEKSQFPKQWKIANFSHNVRAITPIGTTTHQRAGSQEDILALHGDKYSIFVHIEGLTYERLQLNIKAKSEKDTNRLSIFDPKTRTKNYWNNVISEPLKNVLDIKAFVYFPNGELFAFGNQEYCKITIASMGSSIPDLVVSVK